MEKVLVTGGSGFIGQQLSKQLGSARYVVRQAKKGSFTDCIVVDRIDGETDWSNAFYNVDVIIHLAGAAHSLNQTSDRDYREVNVEGTLHLAKEAAKNGVSRFVFISSIGVNGSSTLKEPFRECQEPNPHNEYAQSKYQAELGLKGISESLGIEVVILRPTLVYGPDAPGNFGKLVRLISKLPILPFRLVDNKRDFIAVQNLVDLIITCAWHPNAKGHTFLASDGEAVSIRDFTNAIARGLGESVFQLPIPVSVMRFFGGIVGKRDLTEQLFGNLQVDSSNVREVLEWEAPLTMTQAMKSLRHSVKSKT